MCLCHLISIKVSERQNTWLEEYTARTNQNKSDVVRNALCLVEERDRQSQKLRAREKATKAAEESQYA